MELIFTSKLLSAINDAQLKGALDGIINSSNLHKVVKDNVLMKGSFHPSLGYFLAGRKIEFFLKQDFSIKFNFTSYDDVVAFPALSQFKGSWTDAFRLISDTIDQGWPKEGFWNRMNF
ncbi:MAG: hypothetical protein ACO1PI_10230 [Bacteroidota bacterium]